MCVHSTFTKEKETKIVSYSGVSDCLGCKMFKTERHCGGENCLCDFFFFFPLEVNCLNILCSAGVGSAEMLATLFLTFGLSTVWMEGRSALMILWLFVAVWTCTFLWALRMGNYCLIGLKMHLFDQNIELGADQWSNAASKSSYTTISG